jgi:hypothetical protein
VLAWQAQRLRALCCSTASACLVVLSVLLWHQPISVTLGLRLQDVPVNWQALRLSAPCTGAAFEPSAFAASPGSSTSSVKGLNNNLREGVLGCSQMTKHYVLNTGVHTHTTSSSETLLALCSAAAAVTGAPSMHTAKH